MVSVDDIRRAKTLISIGDREQGSCLSSKLINLQTEIHISLAQRQKEETYQKVYQKLTAIIFGLWNICTLLERIEWTRQYALGNPDFIHTWRNFVSVDIRQFHVEIISLIDYTAEILRITAKSPPCLGSGRYYSDLYEWVAKNGPEKSKRVKKLGQGAADLVELNSWPKDLGVIRNVIVHGGSYALVFGEPRNGTLFQVYDIGRFPGRLGENTFLVNQHVADFELYSAFWLTRLFLFLEDFAAVVGESLKLTLPTTSWLISGGLDVVQLWMDKLADKLSGRI